MNLSPAVLRVICLPETLGVVKLLKAECLAEKLTVLQEKRRELGDKAHEINMQIQEINIQIRISLDQWTHLAVWPNGLYRKPL